MTADNAKSIVHNTLNDYMLLSLDAGFGIYSPGASLTIIDTVTTLTTDPWIWNGEIQYLDSSNQIQTFSEGFNCLNF